MENFSTKQEETNENKEKWAQKYQICGFDIVALCLHARYGTCVNRMQLCRWRKWQIERPRGAN
jgi:hypothetical protein